jgi:integration host factor subunit beta
MVRSGLVRRLSEKRKIGVAEAELTVAAIFDTIALALGRNESVNIRGLGTFSVRRYRGYDGRNPKTGESIEVRPKCLPHFRPGKAMSKALNRAGDASAKAPTVRNTRVLRLD